MTTHRLLQIRNHIYFYSLMRFECNNVINYFCKHPFWQKNGVLRIWCFNLIPEACFNTLSIVLGLHAPTHVKVKGSGSRESVSDLHAYVTVSHQRGPLCVMLFSQFPLILCSCHPNLMTMFYLPSRQLWLLLYSYAMRRILHRPTTKWIIICLKLWDLHLYAWLSNMFLEGYFSGG